MKKILLFFSLCIGALAVPNLLNAQCMPIADGCASTYANVVIGEVSGDSSQSDGCEDAIVEIIGPPGTDIGCMVITDTEWAVLIPAGTTLGADGVFLIGCSSSMTENCGVGNPGMSGLIGGMSTAGEGGGNEGDWNIGLLGEIDFDTCDPANAPYYDPAATGFTLDNTGSQGNNGDGEQVFLFLPDGTPWDGIIWDGGGTGLADHVSVSNGNPYTLGDNDGNGIANDVAGTVAGGRGDGGNATAVPILPTGDGTECVCNTAAEPGTFTVPGYPDPLWYEWTTGDHVGCNSSFIRLDAGTSAGGIGGSPSHMDGMITSSTMVDGYPTDNGGGATGGTTNEGFTPTGFTPTACGDPSAEWAYTDHPTPGSANDDPTFVFYADVTTLCAPTDPVILCTEIYNYQQVSDGSIDSGIGASSGAANGETGSLVYLNGAVQNYDSYVVAGETTTMCVTISAWNLGANSVTLVWDDWSNTNGTSGNPATQGTPNECYETFDFVITVAEPFTLSSTSIACPGDFEPGFVDVSSLIATGGGSPLEYDLQYAGVSQEVNGSGLFNIVTEAVDPITVVVSDPAGCTPPVTVMISADCKAAPPCPEITASMIDDADGVICPGDEVCFDITGFDNLPEGGTIDFYYNATVDFDPYAGEGTLLGSAEITVLTSTPEDCTTLGAGDLAYTFVQGDTPDAFGFVPLVDIAAGTEICFTDNGITNTPDFRTGEGFLCWTAPAGGVPAGTIVTMTGPSPAANWTAANSTASTGTFTVTGSFNLTASGDQMIALCGGAGFDPTDPNANFGGITFLAGATFSSSVWDAGGATSSTTSAIPPGLTDGTSAVALGSGPNPGDEFDNSYFNCAGGSLVGDQAALQAALFDAANWTGDNNVQTPPACTIMNTDAVSGTTVAQFCQVFDESFCNLSANGDFFVEAIINPFTEFDDPADLADCFADDPDRFEGFMLNMACPEAMLMPTAFDVCEADSPGGVDIPVAITGGAGPMYSVVYAIDGVDQPAVMIAAGGTINIPAPTDGEVKVTLTSITDTGGEMCEGTIGTDEVCVNIRPTEMIEITGTALTSCAPTDGTLTFDIAGGGTSSNSFDIDYTGGSVAGVSLPYTITGVAPGTYTITGATDDAGCPANVTGEVTLMAPAASIVEFMPASGCQAAPFDLATLTTTDPVGGAGTFTYYSLDPTTFAPAGQLPGTTVTTSGTYYVEYTENGCTSVAQVDIQIAPTVTSNLTPADCMGNGTDVVPIPVEILGGTPTYTVDATGIGAGTVMTTMNGVVVLSPPAAASGNIVVTDANGCMTTIPVVYDADCLPVELVNFTAELVNDVVELKWNTATELDNSHFVVERSLDGEKFLELGKVQGAGTTTEPQAYDFTDGQPKDVNYYRLKQVDLDGTSEYSNILVVYTTTKDLGTRVFPVPTSETLIVETTHTINSIDIVDVTGRVLSSVQLNAEGTRIELNVTHLAAGTYFIAVQVEQGVEMIRFMKK